MNSFVDFHLHACASPDSNADPAAMCRAAIDTGLSAIAITDHVEMIRYREDKFDVAQKQSYEYAGRMQTQFAGKLRIARGIELGQPLYNLADSEKILDGTDYDFVLYSQHKLNDDVDFYIYDYSHHPVKETMDAYFDAVYDGVKWGRFDSLAHLTYPFRYIPADKRPATITPWQEKVDALLRLLAEKGKALEINTSGMRNPELRCSHPDLPIVRRFRELGGELITVGADAHRPEDVGAHIHDALDIAKEAGFRYIAVYFDGKPEMLKI